MVRSAPAGDVLSLATRVLAGTLIYLVILGLAAPFPGAAGLALTFPALNGLALLFADPSRGWSDTSYGSLLPTGFVPGPALITVFTNGIPSEAKYLVVPP